MYGIFEIYPEQLAGLSDDYAFISSKLKKLASSLDSIKNNLRADSFDDIGESLAHISTDINNHSSKVSNLQATLEASQKFYKNTESAIANAQVTDFSSPSSSLADDSDKTNDNINTAELWDALWSILSSSGTLPTSIVPYLQMLLSEITGQEIDATIIPSIFRAEINRFAFFADVADNGWDDALKNAFGISAYFDSTVTASQPYAEYLKKALSKELSDFADTSTASKTAGSVAKWAGVALTGILETVENFEENDSTGRAIAETVIETGTSVGIGILGTAAVSAGFAAAGVVAAPAVAVAGIATATSIVIDWGVEALTGKDIGEWTSDIICDTTEAIAEGIASIGASFAKWF